MSVAFTVPGRTPSKSNHRHANTKASRESWRRILAYQQEVGLSAIAAGAKRYIGSGPVVVKVLLVNQRLDPDNALKVALDGLKGAAIPDDSGEHVRGVQVAFARDSGPIRTEYRIEWEDGDEGENVA